MIDALRALYAPPEWAVFPEVRSTTGACEGLRVADAVAIELWPSRGFQAIGFEAKRTRSDFQRELRHPDKAATIKAFCAAWYLVVPAPWKLVVMSLRELPESWGLIEVGTGGARVVGAAPELSPVEPPVGFFLSLLRSANAHQEETPAAIGPLVAITRPRVARDRVGLACGHVVAKPLAKLLPPTIPCAACADGRPTDREYVEAAIVDSSADDLREYEALIAGLRRVA